MIKLDDNFLRGSYPPIVTPFKNGHVDYDAYAGLIEFQIANGTHGILVNGTSSEPSTLTIEERNRLVNTAVQAADGRVPVVAATGSQSHAETVALTEFADKAGANALLVVTPYYIKPPQRGIAQYYIDVAQRTMLPMMIYHIPGRTAVSVELNTLEQIMERAPNLVGIKHAVNDLGFASRMLKTFGSDFRVFVGLEELSFPMLAIGACGMMNAVANLAPKKVAQLYEAVRRNDLQAAHSLHFELFELNCSVFYDTNPIPMKYMMRRLGILSSNEHRLPMVPATPELEKRLDEVLTRAGML
ncbi:MAG: 4-hydroxy-tetrahydrodipicolinate synthase [Candidimonas sp.]|nr:MAG: 4-hydroxy-tetrahydrodipicolinate synthase [Candidimonas sp.]TAM20991.1 MAG: 4-hydroxy-tetrahydrodipicolinate synthase [Candidimonas sp.]